MNRIKLRFLLLLVLMALALGIVAFADRNCCEYYWDGGYGWFDCDYNFPEACDPGFTCSSSCVMYDKECNWGICSCAIACQGHPLLE